MRTFLFLIPVLLSSAACSDAEEYREEVGAADEGERTASARASSAEAVSMEEETDRYSFAYSWPQEASAYPALAEELRARADRSLAMLKEEATRDFEEAEGEDWTARPHSAGVEWKVVAETPEWLSLSGDLSSYSGGAHGNYGKLSLVWDKESETALDGVDLFASPQMLGSALGAGLCDALNAQRAKRRGIAVDPESGDMFDQCPAVNEATVLVGSTDDEAFNRIGIYFGPYVAGAYAEGDFELDFPVTTRVLDAVKPEYRSAFAERE